MPSEKACSASRRAIVLATPRAARMRQDEVADLDDSALGIEVVERASAEDLTAPSIDGDERE